MKKEIRIHRHVTTTHFEVIVAPGSSCVALHAAVRKWMDTRYKNKRPVYGVRFIPFGVSFDRHNWQSKDVWSVLDRLGIQPA
jgi:hypothetical protein